MLSMKLHPLCLIPALCLTACGPSPNAPGAGGITKAQAAELNQAAAELDERANAVQSVHPER
jgi:hypothetical protein